MLKIDLRSQTERELINRIDQVTELFKCDWLFSWSYFHYKTNSCFKTIF